MNKKEREAVNLMVKKLVEQKKKLDKIRKIVNKHSVYDSPTAYIQTLKDIHEVLGE